MKKTTNKPFFAKFLEKQVKGEEVKGGIKIVDQTMKHPSDNDEGLELEF